MVHLNNQNIYETYLPILVEQFIKQSLAVKLYRVHYKKKSLIKIIKTFQ